jgi:hypothetical protein
VSTPLKFGCPEKTPLLRIVDVRRYGIECDVSRFKGRIVTGNRDEK